MRVEPRHSSTNESGPDWTKPRTDLSCCVSGAQCGETLLWDLRAAQGGDTQVLSQLWNYGLMSPSCSDCDYDCQALHSPPSLTEIKTLLVVAGLLPTTNLPSPISYNHQPLTTKKKKFFFLSLVIKTTIYKDLTWCPLRIISIVLNHLLNKCDF